MKILPQPSPSPPEPTRVVEADRWVPGAGLRPAACTVAAEVPFTLVVNGREPVPLPATPRDLRELTAGYLLTSGIIRGADEMLDWRCDPSVWRGEVTTASASGRPPASGEALPADNGDASRPPVGADDDTVPGAPPLMIDARAVAAAGEWISECSAVFRESGGVHAAGLYDPVRGPLFFVEDVARHNALDKAVGRALLLNLDLGRLILARTGRASSEIVLKAHRAGLGVLVSRGAPTYPAILLAREAGITLVGFARRDGFTIYTHPGRVLP